MLLCFVFSSNPDSQNPAFLLFPSISAEKDFEAAFPAKREKKILEYISLRKSGKKSRAKRAKGFLGVFLKRN